MRRALLLALLAAASLAPVAHAAPSGQVVQAAEVSFSVPTAHGAVDIELLAATSGGSRALYVLAGPHGKPLHRYSGSVTTSALQGDLTRTTLRTRLLGQPLAVTWVDDNGVAVVIGHTDGTESTVEGWHVAGKMASVDIRFGALRCGIIGVLGEGLVEQTDGYGDALATAPAARPHGRSCRPISS